MPMGRHWFSRVWRVLRFIVCSGETGGDRGVFSLFDRPDGHRFAQRVVGIVVGVAGHGDLPRFAGRDEAGFRGGRFRHGGRFPGVCRKCRRKRPGGRIAGGVGKQYFAEGFECFFIDDRKTQAAFRNAVEGVRQETGWRAGGGGGLSCPSGRNGCRRIVRCLGRRGIGGLPEGVLPFLFQRSCPEEVGVTGRRLEDQAGQAEFHHVACGGAGVAVAGAKRVFMGCRHVFSPFEWCVFSVFLFLCRSECVQGLSVRPVRLAGEGIGRLQCIAPFFFGQPVPGRKVRENRIGNRGVACRIRNVFRYLCIGDFRYAYRIWPGGDKILRYPVCPEYGFTS